MENKPDFTKEQLDAIKIVDKLYQLQEETDRANSKLHKFQKEHQLCRLKRTDNNFRFVVTDVFCNLLDAIERGDLLWKEDAPIDGGSSYIN
jgi:hypothetical protein